MMFFITILSNIISKRRSEKNDGEYKINVNKHTEHNHVKIKKKIKMPCVFTLSKYDVECF